jgi:hypothetical protein
VARRCFQCGVSAPVEELTTLGDGVFCAPCFRQLLTGNEPASPRQSPSRPLASTPSSLTRPSNPQGGAASQPRPKETSKQRVARCLVCESPLSPDGQRGHFLGGGLCGTCTAELNSELASARLAEPAPVASRRLGSDDPGFVQVEASEVQPETPGSGTAQCAGCDRLMPGPGSYRLWEGKPYCAGCLPFYRRASIGVPATPAVPLSAGGPPVAAVCACCESPGSLRLFAGFLICGPCQDSDPSLALAIARARHTRRMVALGQTLFETEP